LQDTAGKKYRVGAFPPKQIHASFLHVLQFGIGPGIELKKGEEVVSQGYVALRLTPFGVVDQFDIQPYSYQFFVSIVPSRTIKKGREIARDYDLEKPRYHLEIVKGENSIYAGEVETDSITKFDGQMTLRFRAPSDWILLEVAYDPFFTWFVIGIVLIAAGLLLSPLSWLLPRVVIK
jgi:hypothetical protein